MKSDKFTPIYLSTRAIFPVDPNLAIKIAAAKQQLGKSDVKPLIKLKDLKR